VVGFCEPPTHAAEPSPDTRLDHEEHVRVGDQHQFDLGHFQSHLKRQAGEGGKVQTVEAGRLQYGLLKSLETVGQKQDVRRRVRIVVLLCTGSHGSRTRVIASSNKDVPCQ